MDQKSEILRKISLVKSKIKESIDDNNAIRCRNYIKTLKRLNHLLHDEENNIDNLNAK